MSSREQYKNLLTKTKRELRQSKIEFEDLAEQCNIYYDEITRLNAELSRIRLRKWWQFWKFLKRNQII